MRRILIVEDDGLIAFDMAMVIEHLTGARTIIAHSVAQAKEELRTGVDFCLLDVDVLDGKTFDLARLLRERGVEFAFASGSSQSNVPDDLRREPFLSKPCSPCALDRVMKDSLIAVQV